MLVDLKTEMRSVVAFKLLPVFTTNLKCECKINWEFTDYYLSDKDLSPVIETYNCMSIQLPQVTWF